MVNVQDVKMASTQKDPRDGTGNRSGDEDFALWPPPSLWCICVYYTERDATKNGPVEYRHYKYGCNSVSLDMLNNAEAVELNGSRTQREWKNQVANSCDHPHTGEVAFGRCRVVVHTIHSKEKKQCSQ